MPVLELPGVPAFCNALAPSAEEARALPRGDINLVYCRRCTLIWNAAFDPGLAAYSPDYNNSLHCSPTFQAHAEDLAERLMQRFGLAGKTVLEIGCGDGDFLATLCRHGVARGVGYDPSHAAGRAFSVPGGGRIEVIPRLFTGDDAREADCVCCRHVLEHVAEPRELLAAVRRSAGERAGLPLYLEVPDATYMLEAGAVWDVIYEHSLYVGEPALRYLLASEGFKVLTAGTSFEGQYLWAEAVTADAITADELPEPADAARLERAAARFGEQLRETVARWDERLAALQQRGPLAVWGAGSKGVTFLNLVPSAAAVRWVVDINPVKQGRYAPGTGHQIAGPEALRGASPASVLLMNGIYEREVRAQLAALGIETDVIAVDSAER